MTADNECKKQYLNRYWIQWVKIDRLQDELEEWQLQAERAALSHPDKQSHSSAAQPTIIKITGLKAEIQLQIETAIHMRHEIESAICKVRNELLKELLMLRYIKRDTWPVIADKIHYDLRHVNRLHQQALAQLELPRCL